MQEDHHQLDTPFTMEYLVVRRISTQQVNNTEYEVIMSYSDLKSALASAENHFDEIVISSEVPVDIGDLVNDRGRSWQSQ